MLQFIRRKVKQILRKKNYKIQAVFALFDSTILYVLYLLYMTSKFHFRNTKQHWVAAAILAPLLLVTVPVTAFALTGYISSEIPLHFPSGSYKEVLNVRHVTDRRLFDAAAQCFAGRGLPHRIIKNSSIQVQESLFRTSIERCWNELNNAKLSTQDPEWMKTQQYWYRGR